LIHSLCLFNFNVFFTSFNYLSKSTNVMIYFLFFSSNFNKSLSAFNCVWLVINSISDWPRKRRRRRRSKMSSLNEINPSWDECFPIDEIEIRIYFCELVIRVKRFCLQEICRMSTMTIVVWVREKKTNQSMNLIVFQ